MTRPDASTRRGPDPAASTSAGGGSTRIVPLLMLVVAAGHFNRVGMSVAGAERIIPELGITPSSMGLVYSAFLLCYTLAMLPGGWLIDRFGPRRALIGFGFGSSLFVAFTGAVGLVYHDGRSVWLGLLVVRALLGLVNAPLHPSGARMVHEYVPAGSRSLANGWVTCAACAGIAATYYGLGALMDRFGWPSAFLACSLATFVVACVWTAGTRGRACAPGPAPGDPRTPQAARGMLDMLTRKGVLCLTVSYAALGYFQYVFFYWIEYYFETIQGQSVDVARRYTTLITLAMGVGMVAGGWIADRLPRSLPGRARRALVPVAGLVGSGLAFEAGVYSSSAAATVAAFMLASALIGSCEGPFWTTVVEMGRPYGGTAAGLMNTGGNAGGTLSPWVTPLLGSFFAAHVGEADGWRMGLAVAGLVPILGAVLWWGVEAAERDPAAVAEAAARG